MRVKARYEFADRTGNTTIVCVVLIDKEAMYNLYTSIHTIQSCNVISLGDYTLRLRSGNSAIQPRIFFQLLCALLFLSASTLVFLKK
jgi:hypothetical protein